MLSNSKLRFISLFTAICLCLTFFTVNVSAEKPVETDGAAAIVAKAQSQVGNSGGSEYKDYFNYSGPWCACFVSWCARTTGIPESVIPTLMSSTDARDFYAEKGLYKASKDYGGNYTPKTGDIAFFSDTRNPEEISHVGIVADANSSYVTCIEGNCSNRVKKMERKYTTYMVGFGTPEYDGIVLEPDNYIPVNPIPAKYAPGTYKLNENMNMRSVPSATGESYGIITKDTTVKITEVNGAWGKLEHNNKTGWISLDFSTRIYETGTYKLNEKMNLRAEPSEKSESYELIPAGAKLDITEISENWGKTVYKNKNGWISLEYSTLLPAPGTDKPVKPEIKPDSPDKTDEQEETTVKPDKPETKPVKPTEPETKPVKPVKPETKPVKPAEPAKPVYIVKENTRLRKEPTTDSEQIDLIDAGSKVTVTLIKDGWGKTVYNGKEGWFSLQWSEVYHPPVPPKHDIDWFMIDISRHQLSDEIDWEKVKEAGVKAVILRIGGRFASMFGNAAIYNDEEFMKHYANAKKQGLHVGVYFYSYALTAEGAEEEAEFVIKTLKLNKCELDMPVFIDMEDYPGVPAHVNAGKTVCNTVLDTFCNVIEDAGYYAGIYSSTNFLENFSEPEVFKGRAAWIANWNFDPDNNEWPEYSGRIDLWQYSESGRIEGTKSNLDFSRCYVDYPTIINKRISKLKIGDVNKDGKLSASDARMILRNSVQIELFDTVQLRLADVDKDGKISAADARLILRMSVGL